MDTWYLLQRWDWVNKRWKTIYRSKSAGKAYDKYDIMDEAYGIEETYRVEVKHA